MLRGGFSRYALRQRLRESVADGLHCMSVPALVVPYAPRGEQNAPGCTPLRGAFVVFDGRGLGFGVALCVAVGRGFAFEVVAAALGLSSTVAAGVGSRVVVAAICSDAPLVAPRLFGLGSSRNAPVMLAPPTHRTMVTRMPRATLLLVLIRRLAHALEIILVGRLLPSGPGAYGVVTTTPWTGLVLASMDRSCPNGRFPGASQVRPAGNEANRVESHWCSSLGAEQRKRHAGTVAIMEPIVEGALVSADGYWRVEIVKFGPKDRWFRIIHATTVVEERASLGTVQRVLGDAYGTLSSVEVGDTGVA